MSWEVGKHGKKEKKKLFIKIKIRYYYYYYYYYFFVFYFSSKIALERILINGMAIFTVTVSMHQSLVRVFFVCLCVVVAKCVRCLTLYASTAVMKHYMYVCLFVLVMLTNAYELS